MKQRIPFVFLAILALLAGGIIWWYINYYVLQKKNAKEDMQIFIPTGSNYSDVLKIISPHLENVENFTTAANKKKYTKIYPGRYTFSKNTSNGEMIERLMKGEQDDIEIMVGNYASVYELSSKLDTFFETDAQSIVKAIAESPEAKGLDTLQMIYFLAPNTYKFHWTNTPDEIIAKIKDPYKKFWTTEKKALLDSTKMNELQVVTLASIVQMESYKQDEQPKVAGVYLNRLKKGMKLDADPTVIFAKKATLGWDEKIQRVTYKDLDQISSYNTYRNAGLPPGPICMPNPSAINAVLNPEPSDFIFFVADTSRPGYHIFAKTYAEHENNAKAYRQWVKNNGIK